MTSFQLKPARAVSARPPIGRRFLFSAALFCIAASAQSPASVTARYVRIDSPMGYVMAWNQVEVYSEGKNVLLHHPEMVTATCFPAKGNTDPTPENIILTNSSEASAITNGNQNPKGNGVQFKSYGRPGYTLWNPWIEVDLGQPTKIDKIVLYAAGWPDRTYYLDKNQRAIALLDTSRKILWADKWLYHDKATYPQGIFAFEPNPQTPAQNPVVGKVVAEKAPDWVSMAWLLNPGPFVPLPDAAQRMQHFAARNSPAEIEKFANRFFAILNPKEPGLEIAFEKYAQGRYADALDSWKKYWFEKMWRLNAHQGLKGDHTTYSTNGDDIMNGLLVTRSGELSAVRYIPGQIRWIEHPDRGGNGSEAEPSACVDSISWPLLYAYKAKPDPRYLQRWAEIMDDWTLNFFSDAEKTPYEVESLFVWSPGKQWQKIMEDLADISKEHPEMVAQIPAITLARMQLTCLEKYPTAWWRQVRETVFNHNTGGIRVYSEVYRYIQEFLPGERTFREFKQGFERWMTLANEPDGSLTEIGDDGHLIYNISSLSSALRRQEELKPDWFTPGWRNRAYEWLDGQHKYIDRHLAPGGFEHRFGVGYRPLRAMSTWAYPEMDADCPPPNRDAAVIGNPEIRRIIDAIGHISTGVPQPSDTLSKDIVDQFQQSHDAAEKVLGGEKPGAPHINSDWMPYTGAYYFKGGWNENDTFLAMMACGSHGGSQAPQWPYSMVYHYDYNFPLFAARPIHVDGLPPQQLYGRMNCFQPGTKTMDLANAEEKPAALRWLSDQRFDFGEAIYHGAYQNFANFKGDWGSPDLQIVTDTPAVTDVDTIRQIVQLRGSRLFIVSDAIKTPGTEDHELSDPFKIALSEWKKGTNKFSPDQLKIDEKAGILRGDNPDSPSVSIYQFADQPIQYQRQGDAKPDGKYGKRIGGEFGIAEQTVAVKVKGKALALVSLVSSRAKGAQERVTTVEPLKQGSAVGFHARLADGGEIWYQFAGMGEAPLRCGPGQAIGQVLLVVRDKEGYSGMLLGGKNLVLNGKPVAGGPNFEFFTTGAVLRTAAINTPIDPVSFEPNRNTFAESETVRMVSKTPNVEIRYTTDGTQPTLQSKLYTGPVKISETTEFAARAYRLGTDGKPLPAEELEVNGTKFSLPTYGWFAKAPMKPATTVAEQEVEPGLNYDYLQSPWWRLYSSAHWLPAQGGGTAAREMDLSKVSTNDYYGMRYKGYIKVPADGTYTFHAPHELCYMDNAPSYDLRVYIDGEEWYLTQWWHGHGTWTVPLAKGFHTFQVDFADARTTPWRKSGLWRYYPRPWAVYKGNPSDILISGPGLEKSRIPKEWFFRKPEKRTFTDERTLVDSLTGLHCEWDGAVDVSTKGIGSILLKTTGAPQNAFGGLVFQKADGSKQTFAQIATQAKQTPGGLLLDLRGQYERLGGTVSPDPQLKASIIYENLAR